MKIKELSQKEKLLWLKIDAEDITEEEEKELQMIEDAAIQYIYNQTGAQEGTLEEKSDVTIAVLVLMQDMHDNRRLYVDNQNVNKVVDNIIFQYRENLL